MHLIDSFLYFQGFYSGVKNKKKNMRLSFDAKKKSSKNRFFFAKTNIIVVKTNFTDKQQPFYDQSVQFQIRM